MSKQFTFEEPEGVTCKSAWEGFYRSKESDSGRRHRAKCKSCQKEFQGEPKKLWKHKSECGNMDDVDETSTSSIKIQILDATDVQKNLDKLLCKGVATGDVPSRFLNNDFFVQWQEGVIDAAQKGIEIRRLSDRTLRREILPEVVAEVKQRVIDQIREHDCWTICMDGWTNDPEALNYYSIMLFDGVKQIHLDNLTLDPRRLTGESLLKAIMLVISPYLKNIKGIVTNSSPILVKFRTEFSRQYPKIIPIGCCLYLLNLVCKDVLTSEEVQPLVDNISKIAVFFSNSNFWREKLRNRERAQGITAFTPKYVEVRWYSFPEMVKYCMHYKDGFTYCLNEADKQTNSKYPPIPVDISNMIRWGTLEVVADLAALTEPIADVITRLEEKSAHMGQVWAEFLKLHAFYKQKQSDARQLKIYKKLVDRMIDSLNAKAKELIDPIHLVGLYLMPSHRYICISKLFTRKDLHCHCLDLAKSWGFTKKEAQDICEGLIRYHQNQEPHHGGEPDPIAYWHRLRNSEPNLAKLANTILKLCPSTATMERVFSNNKLGAMKPKCRNRRLDHEAVKGCGQIKLDILNNSTSMQENNPIDIKEEEWMEFQPLEWDITTDGEQDEDEEVIKEEPNDELAIDQYFLWQNAPFIDAIKQEMLNANDSDSNGDWTAEEILMKVNGTV